MPSRTEVIRTMRQPKPGPEKEGDTKQPVQTTKSIVKQDPEDPDPREPMPQLATWLVVPSLGCHLPLKVVFQGYDTPTVSVTVLSALPLIFLTLNVNHRSTMNHFNGTKNGDIDGTCKWSLTVLRTMDKVAWQTTRTTKVNLWRTLNSIGPLLN